jgi:hypothetical protein
MRGFFDFFGEDVALWAENIHHDLPVKLAVYKDIAQNGQSPETIDDPAVILNIIDALAALDICSSVGEYDDTQATTYLFSSSDGQQYGFTFSRGCLLFRHKLYEVRDAARLAAVEKAAAF